MAFYLIGLKPENVSGIFFRNHLRQWWPLWDYVYNACSDILTQQDYMEVKHHDFHVIDGVIAHKIASRLLELAKAGLVQQEEQDYRAMLEKLPKETCPLCNGKGFRELGISKTACRACNGSGERESYLCNYVFDEDNVVRFAEFCKNSGGFRFG